MKSLMCRAMLLEDGVLKPDIGGVELDSLGVRRVHLCDVDTSAESFFVPDWLADAKKLRLWDTGMTPAQVEMAADDEAGEEDAELDNIDDEAREREKMMGYER